MKLIKKNVPVFIAFLLMGCIIGSIFWEIFERILHLFPDFSYFTLTMKQPAVLLDIYVIALAFRANPGTLLGLIGGIIFFFRI